MIKLGIKIALISLTILSCSKRRQSEISIDSKTMAEMLAEIQIAEATVNAVGFSNQDSSKVAFKQLEKAIYKKFNTDSVNFVRNFNMYASDKATMIKIYENAEAYIKKQKSITNTERK